MATKSNLETFISKYKCKFPNSIYSLEKVLYVSSSSKIICICPLHGQFKTTPNKLLSGTKCAECAGSVKVKDINDFLIRNKNKKNILKYSYDNSVYYGNGKKMTVTCKTHGDFEIKPNNLLNGQGCPKCSKNCPYVDFEDFLERNKNNLFLRNKDIDKTSFINSKSKLKIKCHIHGNYYMSAWNLLKGCDCSKCSKCYKPKDIIDFLETNSDNINLNKYTFENAIYTNALHKFNVTCKKHGSFMIQPSSLLTGNGCPKCGDYGFKPSKPATLYVLKITTNNNLEAIGFGISNNFDRRIIEHKKTFEKNNIRWSLLKKIEFENGEDCLFIENLIKSKTEKLNMGISGFKKEATNIENLPIINQIINNIKIKKI